MALDEGHHGLAFCYGSVVGPCQRIFLWLVHTDHLCCSLFLPIFGSTIDKVSEEDVDKNYYGTNHGWTNSITVR